MDYPYGDTITLSTRSVTGQDQYGNDVYGSVDTTVTGAFAPGGSTFLIQGQQTVIDQDTAYLPAGTTVGVEDRLTIRGTTYQVDGKPQDWRNPFTGWQAGIVVKLLEVTG